MPYTNANFYLFVAIKWPNYRNDAHLGMYSEKKFYFTSTYCFYFGLMLPKFTNSVCGVGNIPLVHFFANVMSLP